LKRTRYLGILDRFRATHDNGVSRDVCPKPETVALSASGNFDCCLIPDDGPGIAL
jgi:hypothetical protein